MFNAPAVEFVLQSDSNVALREHRKMKRSLFIALICVSFTQISLQQRHQEKQEESLEEQIRKLREQNWLLFKNVKLSIEDLKEV